MFFHSRCRLPWKRAIVNWPDDPIVQIADGRRAKMNKNTVSLLANATASDAGPPKYYLLTMSYAVIHGHDPVLIRG